jgi:uncharacterized protein GlcG (DUF336 family)
VRPAASIAAAAAVVLSIPLAAAQSTFTVRVLTPETALKAAQAALKKCRDGGYQATVAVVDRMGVLQVLLRDRFAGPHTPDMARAKAYTAARSPRPRSRAGRRAASATGPKSRRWAAGS